MTFRLSRIFAWLLIGPFACVFAAPPVLTKVVDTATPVPSGAGNFSSFAGRFFGTQPNAPALDGASVVFSGVDFTGRPGLYRWDPGHLSMLANTGTVMPGGTSKFADFRAFSFKGTRVAFLAADGNNRMGIYEIKDGQISTMADTTMNAPGTAFRFYSFSGPSMSDDGPWYSGWYQDQGRDRAPLYHNFVGGSQNPVVGTSTPVPGGTGNFFSVESVDSDGSSVFFRGDYANFQRGIYHLDSSGAVSLIANLNTTIPGTTRKFRDFEPSISSSGNDVVFVGWDQLLALNVRSAGGILDIVGDSGQQSQPVAMSLGHPAFIDRQGILWAETDSSVTRVIGIGDNLGGKIVGSVLIGRDSYQAANIDFVVKFNDGSQAIYIASLPEPASLALFSLSLLLGCRWRAKVKSHFSS